ncbi:MAG: 4Fe-4S binding protein [Pirellulaceae bacterium]|nr:4Fe-4S binding protein [Pirellulaceae bacterium]
MLAVTAVSVLAAGLVRADSPALLRLDHFRPFVSRIRRRLEARHTGWLVQAAGRWLPARWLSDDASGRPGIIRRVLQWLGPSVIAAPLRRVVQALCFGLFLLLFFYVCWPYTSRPAPPARSSAGWQLGQLEQQSGEIELLDGEQAEWLVAGQHVYVVDQATQDRSSVASLRVKERDGGRLALSPVQASAIDSLELFLLSDGPWTLHDAPPNAWPTHYADDLAAKEWLPADFFLVIDPLVSLSTAVASRSWVWSLGCAGAILVVCVLIPRGFCGYLCPLGTLIDLFDWSLGRRITRFRLPDQGWWVHIKYYLLLAVMLCALGGVLVSGYVAAIPVITRGMLMLGEPLQSGLLRGWHLVPAPNAGHGVSLALFLAVLGLGLLRPRFWCKYVCPSGAVFSLGNLLRVSQRHVEQSCIHCNKCVEICPFDAIKPDFTTRVTDCTLCQTCAGVCPTQSIKFVERWNDHDLKPHGDPPTHETALGRRGFLSLVGGTGLAVAGSAAMTGATRLWGADLASGNEQLPVRPPGSVPEREFLQMCIRCGECFKACPNNVLQPMGFQQGLDGLWTPHVVADWAGCESSCNACGQVCPTGAIRALPLEEKRVARMGLAIVDQQTCLPLANREACQLCVDECRAAGYDAIEFMQVHTQVDAVGQPLAGTGYLAPVVQADRCVGCGLCQTRCYAVNVKQRHVLVESAIVIEAGEGKEDRLMRGSYLELRRRESSRPAGSPANPEESGSSYFIPDGPDPSTPAVPGTSDGPFGVDEAPGASGPEAPFH